MINYTHNNNWLDQKFLTITLKQRKKILVSAEASLANSTCKNSRLLRFVLDLL